jgi:DNA-binding GntR family transcriptional regulator
MALLSATKAEAVYQDLRTRILDGSLQPGSNLDQKALAEEYSISTTPIREALRRLESEHLAVVKAHHGPRVAPLSVQELHYLFAVRLQLDPLAGRLAANAPIVEREAIARLHEEHSWETPAERVSVNRQFHRAIYDACGNPVLIQVLESLWNRCDRYRFLLAEAHNDVYHDQEEHEHSAIVSALKEGNGDDVEVLLREHIQNSYQHLVSLAEDFTAFPAAVSE